MIIHFLVFILILMYLLTDGNRTVSGGATMGAPGQMTWLEDPPPWLRPA